jgi:hypothetical protein
MDNNGAQTDGRSDVGETSPQTSQSATSRARLVTRILSLAVGLSGAYWLWAAATGVVHLCRYGGSSVLWLSSALALLAVLGGFCVYAAYWALRHPSARSFRLLFALAIVTAGAVFPARNYMTHVAIEARGGLTGPPPEGLNLSGKLYPVYMITIDLSGEGSNLAFLHDAGNLSDVRNIEITRPGSEIDWKALPVNIECLILKDSSDLRPDQFYSGCLDRFPHLRSVYFRGNDYPDSTRARIKQRYATLDVGFTKI